MPLSVCFFKVVGNDLWELNTSMCLFHCNICANSLYIAIRKGLKNPQFLLLVPPLLNDLSKFTHLKNFMGLKFCVLLNF